MLAKRQHRSDTDTLIWEYLDNQSTPSRLSKLQHLLKTRKEDRKKLVDSAVLHTMLFQYYAAQASQVEAGESKKRRSRRKQNAA